MYLVDTNIWLERLLEQERNEEVAKFLNLIPTEKLFITDFSFHSISIILTKLRKFKILTTFIHDVFYKRGSEFNIFSTKRYFKNYSSNGQI